MATLILRETYRALEEEMKTIDRLKRETSKRIKEAADHGDLKENAEYHAAREEQSLIVYKKQLMQSHAPFRFIEDGDIDIDEVGFGNKVAVLEEGKDDPEIYTNLTSLGNLPISPSSSASPFSFSSFTEPEKQEKL